MKRKLEGKIGLEVHVQLDTKTKLFCSCPTESDRPDSATCPTCLGMPGAKPVLSRKVVEHAIRLALALSSEIQPEMMFSRKTYFYPDMSKSYQITQYEKPLALGGFLKVGGKKIRIRRIHIEEDPASLKHPKGISKSDYTLVDYSRSGIPLCEIVTEPDMTTPKEARQFLTSLLSILGYLGIYDPRRFSLRADACVSVMGGKPVEIKEITGAKETEDAIGFEIVRQIGILMHGGKVETGTRHYDQKTGSTIPLRKKETEEEYGYIFDSDLPVFPLDKRLISSVRESIPELPQRKMERFKKDYGLSEAIAEQLVIEKELADCFESLSMKSSVKTVATWLTGYLRKTLVYRKMSFAKSRLKASHLEGFFEMILAGKLTDRGGELLLRELALKPQDPKKLARRLGLLKMEEESLEKVLEEVLKKQKVAAKELRAGKEKTLHFLVGIVMKKTGGRADAKAVQKLLKKRTG